MVDWMIEVFTKFNTHDQTFIQAVALMDRYFSMHECRIPLRRLHIVGIACISLASKYEEGGRLKLGNLVDEVSHGKYSREELQAKEMDILRSIKFRLGVPTSLTFLESFAHQLLIMEGTDQKEK
jgi:hypothetical protein